MIRIEPATNHKRVTSHRTPRSTDVAILLSRVAAVAVVAKAKVATILKELEAAHKAPEQIDVLANAQLVAS